jgi:hypothetical protein
MEFEGAFIFDDDGVTGIIAALKANYQVGLLGQIIDDAPFAFIPPLGPHHCCD